MEISATFMGNIVNNDITIAKNELQGSVIDFVSCKYANIQVICSP
jgi:hypothetical protein